MFSRRFQSTTSKDMRIVDKTKVAYLTSVSRSCLRVSMSLSIWTDRTAPPSLWSNWSKLVDGTEFCGGTGPRLEFLSSEYEEVNATLWITRKAISRNTNDRLNSLLIVDTSWPFFTIQMSSRTALSSWHNNRLPKFTEWCICLSTNYKHKFTTGLNESFKP